MSRYYNPELARFISEDTYRGELDDPLSLNRYVYVKITHLYIMTQMDISLKSCGKEQNM